MPEYKTFFIGLELFTNVAFPTPLLSLNKEILIPYALLVTLPAAVLVYIYIMKRAYFKKFLCRTYVPGTNLIILTESLDLIFLVFMYYQIFSIRPEWGWWLVIPAVHILLTTSVYLLLLFQKVRNRAVIAYTRHEYKLGIIANDIGGENGLRKGQPVEIVQEIPGGYIVKDSSKNDYSVKTEDIESIIEIV